MAETLISYSHWYNYWSGSDRHYLFIIFCEECITEVQIVDTPNLLVISKVLHHCHVCSCLCTNFM